MVNLNAFLHHCAIMVSDIHWNIHFFNDVFGMEIYQMEGNNEAPKQIWLDGGIQLIASQGVEIPGSCLLNHICLRVPDVETALMKANKYHISTLAKGQNWIVLDYGLCIEILPME